MGRLFLLTSLVFLALFMTGCGSSSQLEGLSLGAIEFEGEHADDIKADLEQALQAAGATLNASGGPKLVGKLTWEWAGDGAEPYPTLVKVFMQSDPEERKFTVSTQYKVPEGAQPQNVAHYRGQIVERIVARIAAQNRDAS